MGILVFLPDYEGDSPDELAARGLGDLLAPTEVTPLFVPVRKGPTGGPGRLVAFYPSRAPREYDADSQTWMESPPDGELAAGRYWLGYATKAKPGPEDLQRRDLIDGEPVVLADNKIWIVPSSEHAPKRITRDRTTGAEKETIKDQYREWVDKSNEIFGMILADGYGTLSNPDYQVKIPGGLRYCALSLRHNYRVNADVLDLLELIDSHVISDVVLAACGITGLAKLVEQKKKDDAQFPNMQPS